MSRKIKFFAAFASIAINAGVIASAASALGSVEKSPALQSATSAITIDGRLLLCETANGAVVCS